MLFIDNTDHIPDITNYNTIVISKMQSFYPIIQNINNHYKNKRITIVCYPYKGNRELLLRENKYKYEVKLNYNIRMFVNDKKINTSYHTITIDEDIDNDFISDIFRLFPNINTYKWRSFDINYHHTRFSYGNPAGEWIRVQPDIVKIEQFSSDATYSGRISYYNLKTNKTLYSRCNCFYDQNEADNILCNY
jgi:hypothetical protein